MLPEEPDNSVASSLLYRAKNRDEAAWERLNHLFGPMILSWVQRAGIRGPDADDVAQQVLQQILRNIDSFQRSTSGDTFTGWVWATTKFRIRDFFVRVRPDRAAGGSVAHDALQQLSDVELDSRVFDEESVTVQLTRNVLAMIRTEFEANTWDAFWLATVEQHKPAEIAASLGMTLQAVYKARSRVLKRVRTELADIIRAETSD